MFENRVHKRAAEGPLGSHPSDSVDSWEDERPEKNSLPAGAP